MGQVSGKIDSFAPVAATATKYYFEYRMISLIVGSILFLIAMIAMMYMVSKGQKQQKELMEQAGEDRQKWY